MKGEIKQLLISSPGSEARQWCPCNPMRRNQIIAEEEVAASSPAQAVADHVPGNSLRF